MRTRGLVAGTIAISLVVAAGLRGRTRRFAIREDSMVPTLRPDDWIIALRRTRELERGDVVVFDDPTHGGRSLVKRVIGLPGERVGVDAGRVTIDGALLADRWANGTAGPDGEWEIGADAVWVLGDNRAHSRSDGRTLGPIPLSDIHWIVTARYWPRHRVGRVSSAGSSR